MTAAAAEGPGTELATTDRDVPALLARRRLTLLRPIADPSEIIAVQNETRDFVHKALKKGRDFGEIPGTAKNSLLKPGAERIALGFGCYYGKPVIVEKEIDHNRDVPWRKTKAIWEGPRGKRRKVRDEVTQGISLGLYRYVVEVPLIDGASGRTIANGIAVCSTMESKYIDRPRDSENTVLKMAHKRAVIAACLLGFGLSDEFTQDVEDLENSVDEEPGEVGDPARSDAKSATRKEKPAREKRMPMGKNRGKQLGEIDAKDLESAVKWCRENNKYPDLVSAIADVLAERKRDQSKAEHEAKQAGAGADQDSPGGQTSTANEIASPTSGPAREAAPANPQPAAGDAGPSASRAVVAGSSAAEKRKRPENRARWSAAELQKHALELLEDPVFKGIRSKEKALLDGALGHEALVSKVLELEKTIADARTKRAAEDDDLPF